MKRRRRDAPAGIRAGTSSTSKPAAGSSRGPPRMFARILASEFILDIKATSARCIMLTHTRAHVCGNERVHERFTLSCVLQSARADRRCAVSSVAALSTSRNYSASRVVGTRCLTLVFTTLDYTSTNSLSLGWVVRCLQTDFRDSLRKTCFWKHRD